MNSRWFGTPKSAWKAQSGTVSNVVKRGTIVKIRNTTRSADVYMVMAIFKLYYRKWLVTDDPVVQWDPKATKSIYKLSLRRVKLDAAIGEYQHVDWLERCV